MIAGRVFLFGHTAQAVCWLGDRCVGDRRGRQLGKQRLEAVMLQERAQRRVRDPFEFEIVERLGQWRVAFERHQHFR